MIACVELPELPLQLVWRHRPAWRQEPVVVIEEDRPQARVLWACERARARRVLPGQRYAHALSLCGGLRGQVIGPTQLAAALEELVIALAKVAPRVEAAGAAVLSATGASSATSATGSSGLAIEGRAGRGASRASRAPRARTARREATLGAMAMEGGATSTVSRAGAIPPAVGWLSVAASAAPRVASSRQGSQASARTPALRSMRALAPASPAELSTAGTFWLDGAGLDPIYPDAAAWGTAIQKAVAACGYAAIVVVGFARFATHAIARATPLARAARPIVFSAEPAERRAAAAVPLARLEIEPALRDTLARLGVITLGQLIQLPGGELLERFGAAAYRLHQLASAARWDPLVPVAPPELVDEVVLLDDEEREIEGLVFVAKGAVDRLLGRLAAGRRALTALHLELRLRHAVGHLETRVDRLRPAAPTLDARALLRLVHLRLEGAPPAAGVVALRVWAEDAPATREQLALFAERPRRELRAADEALARLRAELGEDAVVTPVLREGHLPEARFGWQRLGALAAAHPAPRAAPPLIRRIFAKPRPLPVQTTSMRDDGWMLSDAEHGSVVRLCGPFLLSGGWWASEVCREYHFAETAHGHCLWAYYDRVRRLWFLQGELE